MFKIVEVSNNCGFEDDLISQSPGEGLQVKNFVHCLHIVFVIGEYTDVFRWDFSGGGGSEREGYMGRSFHGGVLHGARHFP